MTTATKPSGPTRFGVALFPCFELLDMAGPLEALITYARDQGDEISLHMIAETMEPVSTGPILGWTAAASCSLSINPHYTFANAPELDVLIVPGGYGTGPALPNGAKPNVDAVVNFIRDRYPTLQYLFTICTGSGLAALAGVLDGHSATTNKAAWRAIPLLGPKTEWIARARWVRSGNIWTTSGVSAGTDGFFAWMAFVYGEKVSYDTAVKIEYERQMDPEKDPFAKIYGDEDVAAAATATSKV